jgi:hypothetical protein
MRPRRQILLVGLALLALAGCSGTTAGRVAYQRDSQGYAIEMDRGLTRPVAAGDVIMFKRVAPVEWNQVRDGAVIERVLADFNAHPDEWRELPAYRREMLWRPRPEAPL